MENAKTIKDENPSREAVVNAYSRLALRYPKLHFAEKHRLITEAKTALLEPHSELTNIFTSETVDVSNLLSKVQPANESNTPTEQNPVQDILRQIVIRETQVASMMASSSGIEVPGDINEFIDSIFWDD